MWVCEREEGGNCCVPLLLTSALAQQLLACRSVVAHRSGTWHPGGSYTYHTSTGKMACLLPSLYMGDERRTRPLFQEPEPMLLF